MKMRLRKIILGSVLITALLCCYMPSLPAKAMNDNNRFEKVDEFVEKQKKENHIPALAIGIVNSEGAIYQKGFGKADSEGRSVTPQTPFMLGSVSKSFTALAVMQLVDAGKLNLDDYADHYLPWFKASYKGKEQHITLRQLLHHTSGIKGFYVASVADNTTLDQLVHGHLNNQKLKTLPGTKCSYSNANYNILGRIIQEVSGMTFPEYITKNIFEPLEMKHSYVSKEEALKNHLADGNRKWFGLPVKTVAKDVPFFEYSLPSGYLISCLEDMTHYVGALINQGRYNDIAIASEDSIKLLFNTEVEEENVPAGIDGTKSFYGFGWRIIYNNDSINMYQHSGETAHYHANLVIKPEEHIGIIQLDNFGGDMSPISIGTGVADIMIGKEPTVTHFISTVYMVERIIVLIIIILLIVSLIRLKPWYKRITKSKVKFALSIVFAILVNVTLPCFLLFVFPKMYDSTWAASMHIYPDIAWTVLLSSIILLLIGTAKGLLICKSKIK